MTFARPMTLTRRAKPSHEPWQPHPYQRRASAFLQQQNAAALFLDPGLGKTSIMLAAYHLLRKQKMVKRMLVVVPLRPMYLTWPVEVKKWDAFRDVKVGILHGPAKDGTLLNESVDVHVINPEGLKWLFKTLDQMGIDPKDMWDVLCIDESTRFKHSDTERFKLLRPRLERFSRRYILTGSPAPNGLLDLWGQVFILDLGNALYPYFTTYRKEFFESDYAGFKWTPKYNAEGKIYGRLAPLALRMSAEDYLQLPPLVGACGYGEPLVRLVELPQDARRVYTKMEEEMIADLEEDRVTAANAAAVAGKCRQIANGGLYGSAPRKDMNDERGMYDLHDVKTDAVEEIVEELQGVPALISYEFAHDKERLLRRFGQDTPWVGGGVSPSRFKEIERAWNAGELPILLAQPSSVAHGLNLQATRAAVIWHSITWDLEVYEQFIRRVWRQGQKERVFVYHVAAKDTIDDQLVIPLLKSKDATQRSLLKALKETYVP